MRAAQAAGVRLVFDTNSPNLEFTMVCEAAEDEVLFDLTREGELLETVELAPEAEKIRFENLGSERSRVEIWLPPFAAVRVGGVSIEDGAELEPVIDDSRPRWVAYGSSITHCRTVWSPARTWPAVAARQCGLHLTSLGYGGSCQLESMMGRMLRDLEAELFTLKLGINVYGGSTLNLRTFQPAVIGLVKLIREKHPETPIGLITPIFSPPREEVPCNTGMTLEDYRDELRAAFVRLRDLGDEYLFLFEGQDLLGPTEGHLLPDDLHPSPEGYELMGQRAAESILPALLAARRD